MFMQIRIFITVVRKLTLIKRYYEYFISDILKRYIFV